MGELENLRDMAKANGQLSAAIQAELKRGELRRFYVKQVESGDAGEFSRMSAEELDASIPTMMRQIAQVDPGFVKRLLRSSKLRPVAAS